MKMIISGVLVCMILLLTACSDELLVEPKDLMKPPRLSCGQERIKKFLADVIPSECVLSAPVGMDRVAAINFADLNSDGIDEIVSFYKYREHARYGVVVIGQEKNGLKKITDIEAVAKGIDYVSFADMDRDGISEIEVGWDTVDSQNKDKELHIYKLDNLKLKKVFSQSYNEIAIDNLDADSLNEIALISFESGDEYYDKIPKLKVFKYGKSGNVIPVGEIEIGAKGYVDGRYILKSGNAAKGKKGLFVEMEYSNTYFATELVVIRDSKLEKIFENKKGIGEYPLFEQIYPQTFKDYETNSTDIDSDGIVEIGRNTRPFGHEDSSKISVPWISSWYRWDGKCGLEMVRQSYRNASRGYEMIFPQDWNDNVTVKRSDYGEKPNWVTISQIDKETGGIADLYTIFSFEKGELDYQEYSDSRFIRICGQNGRQYVIRQDCRSQGGPKGVQKGYGGMIMTKDEIFDSFKILE